MTRAAVVFLMCGLAWGCGSDSVSAPSSNAGSANGGAGAHSAGAGGVGGRGNGGASGTVATAGAAGSVGGSSSCGPLGNDCSDAACVAPTYECLSTGGANVCQLENRYVSGILCTGNDCPTQYSTCLLYKGESGGICVTSAELTCACASKNKATYTNCTP